MSYETKDRKEGLKRLQIIETPFFMDLLSMDPGDRWEKKLYEKIGDCDLFLLFGHRPQKSRSMSFRKPNTRSSSRIESGQ